MTRADEIKYLQNIINNIEKSEKPVGEIAIPSWIFMEIATCFLNNCRPLKE